MGSIDATANAPEPDQPDAKRPARRMLRALSHRNYRLFFGGQLVSLVGTFLTQVATIWLVYRLTHDTATLGVVGFAGQIPMFVLAPFAGVWADRVNRRRLLVVTQSLAMLQSLAMAALALAGVITVPEIVALSVLQGLINAVDLPARQAFLVEMVADPGDLANAIALNSTMVHGARLVGPAMAGLLIHWVGEGWCFLIDGASYAGVIWALLAMRVAARPPKTRRGVWADFREGLAYVWQAVPIRALLLLMATISLTVMPALTTLMPIFAEHFGGPRHGDSTLGFLMTSSGFGALGGAIYLASRRSVVGLGRVIAIAGAAFGLAVIAFACSGHLWLTLMIVPVAGAGMILSIASSNTVLQTITHDEKRGRVMSFFSMAFIGMTPWGNLIAGYAARHLGHGDNLLGTQRTLLIGGGVCIAATAVFALRLPALRKIVRPIFVEKGILPQISDGLAAAAELNDPAEV